MSVCVCVCVSQDSHWAVWRVWGPVPVRLWVTHIPEQSRQGCYTLHSSHLRQTAVPCRKRWGRALHDKQASCRSFKLDTHTHTRLKLKRLMLLCLLYKAIDQKRKGEEPNVTLWNVSYLFNFCESVLFQCSVLWILLLLLAVMSLLWRSYLTLPGRDGK